MLIIVLIALISSINFFTNGQLKWINPNLKHNNVLNIIMIFFILEKWEKIAKDSNSCSITLDCLVMNVFKLLDVNEFFKNAFFIFIVTI